ncbi:MAG: hypothetical protein ACWGNV_09975 [Bacteroidales bacterium]
MATKSAVTKGAASSKKKATGTKATKPATTKKSATIKSSQPATAKKSAVAKASKPATAKKSAVAKASKPAASKKTATKSARTGKKVPSHEEISQKAHEIYMDRVAKGEPGDPDSDWHKAVDQL